MTYTHTYTHTPGFKKTGMGVQAVLRLCISETRGAAMLALLMGEIYDVCR
jgi:hypothetical protein